MSTKKSISPITNPDGFEVWTRRFCEHLRVRNYSERTITTTRLNLTHFATWAEERSIETPGQVTKPILETYQRWCFHYRKPNGKPLTFSSQRQKLQKLRGFFKWLARTNVITSNPASELELPRIERRIPKAILSEKELEKVFAVPDLTDILGVRDRTMMEVLYSTGIRRHELAGLGVTDVDEERSTVTVRLGKGRKDRTVPIGRRALDWIGRYLDDVRPQLVIEPDDGVMFLNEHGSPLDLGYLTNLMKAYVDGAKLGKTGACHIFRHTMATLMLEHGADVRHIQEILGHVEASTTAVYTRVSIKHLVEVHRRCHPGARVVEKPREPEVEEAKEKLLEQLDQEDDEDHP